MHTHTSTPIRKGPKRRPLADRFWEKVNKTDTCWLWTAATDRRGYGKISAGGHSGRFLTAPRVAWELARGPIAVGLSVLHRCDTPACVNPDHLFLGTQADNLRDMVSKGRQYRKLSDADVRAIRAAYGPGVTLAMLAARYGVSDVAISKVVHRRVWPDA